MRIATPHIAAAYGPTDASESFDLVSPSRLFQLAAIRFEAAIATSRIGGPNTAPSAIVAVMALQQAQSGLNILQSINTPSTPFATRIHAERALDHTRHAIVLLNQYHASVAPLGDAAHRRDSLPSETLSLLDDGRRELDTAIAIARIS
ncbi:MAG: hypothetical protein JWL76_1192 [Thermoleophilia bacterium]|nr:hypothetical protein [Thermoleophilia bacterium]